MKRSFDFSLCPLFPIRPARSSKKHQFYIRRFFRQAPCLPRWIMALILAFFCVSLASCQAQGGQVSDPYHTVSYELPLSSQQSLTLELCSGDNGGSGALSPLNEIQVYEGDSLLQTIDIPALTSSEQPVQVYNPESHQVETIPMNHLAEDSPYLYEGLFAPMESDPDALEFSDFNFDGYTDFALPVFSVAPHNLPFAFFLWNPVDEKYALSFLMFAPVQLLPEEQRLVEPEHGPQSSQRRYYSFDQQGQLFLVRQETELYGFQPDLVDPYPGSIEISEAFRRVMVGDAPFIVAVPEIDPDDRAEYYLSQLDELIWNDPEINAYAERFAVADLDADGTAEIVILTNQHIHSEPVLILRWQDGTIYGYQEVGRGLNSLKADGTYSCSDSAFENGFARDQYLPHEDGSDLRTKIYLGQRLTEQSAEQCILNGRIVNRAEYEAAEADQNAKPDAQWHDFTFGNIAALFVIPTGGK
ncbi:XAC2610-related protein [Flavonifractor plautii]|uniref:Uncharacterized protein n=1 Tax=Flavonifractor plautii TaxID=292800 RepID=A0A6I2R314_FLAPL|nr:hypothetical protein [Flavonifractor plautii]MSB20581.1 hypothetical protein [Flavonifractor plautii]MSB84436.1 hypothetical protein [Flavonifractor plautii]